MKLPLVVTEHYSGLLLGTASEDNYRRVKATIEQSDALIYVGQRFQDTLSERLSIRKDTHVIPNLFDPAAFTVNTDRFGLSRMRRESANTITIGSHKKSSNFVNNTRNIKGVHQQ